MSTTLSAHAQSVTDTSFVDARRQQRVAFIGIKGLPAQAGADRVVEAIVRGIDNDVFKSIVYCSDRAVEKDVTISGVEIVRISALPGKHLHATSLFLFSAIHAVIFGNYNLVHLHNVEASFTLPLLRLRYRVISTSHGLTQKRDKWNRLAKFLISLTELTFIYLSTCVTSVSLPVSDYYRSRYQKRVDYLPNGVADDDPIDVYAAQELLALHGVVSDRYIMFAAGRIMATKGCHLLLEAFQKIDEDIHLVIVGDSSHIPEYERYLYSLADDRVTFIPFVKSKSTLLGLVQSASLFVFPSTLEAMSMMLLEAAYTGVPILCSDIPENTSIMPKNALCFRSQDSNDLRCKMEWALAHPEQMDIMANESQQWISETYRWEDIVKQYEELYLRYLDPTPC